MYLPSLVSALHSHFCLCGGGRECSAARTRACGLKVLYFVLLCIACWTGSGPVFREWGPLSIWHFFSAGVLENVHCCHQHKLRRKCTNGDTGMSCREFPAECCSLPVPQKMGSWHYIIYKMDYFYGFLQTKFCKMVQGSFLVSTGNILIKSIS